MNGYFLIIIAVAAGSGKIKTEVIHQGKHDQQVAWIDLLGAVDGEMATNAREMIKHVDEKKYKALVVHVDSPGGGVTASDVIFHQVLNFRRQKQDNKKRPVVALMGSVAASGGYYISSAADKIVAHPTTTTGSIGVIAYFMGLSGTMEKLGIKPYVFTSTEATFKDTPSPFRPMTPQERAYIQAHLDFMHERFVAAVAEGRKGILTLDQVRSLADGRIYNANQALDQKLIDQIGYEESAWKLAAKMAGLKNPRIVRISPYTPFSFKSLMARGAASAPLINVNLKSLDELGVPRFLYLWRVQ